MSGLTHVDSSGEAKMVDVSEKKATRRSARAAGKIMMSAEAFGKVRSGEVEKGAVLAVARVAAIGAMKRTAELIPLCHPLPLDRAEISFELIEAESAISCEALAVLEAKTGPEMEAIMGVMGGLVAIYDMCKAIDKSMEISGVRLLSKSGGKSGDWAAPAREA